MLWTFSAYYSGMRRLICALALVVLGSSTVLYAQSGRLDTFQANFSSANLQTKLEILRASESEDAAAFGPLYAQALSFVVSNAEDLDAEPLLREIAFVAMARVAAGSYTPALNDAWRLYLLYNETTARIQLLNVLAEIAVGSDIIIDAINEWLLTQHNLFAGGRQPDLQVVRTAIETAGALGDGSSYDAVATAILVQYPDVVVESAVRALTQLDAEIPAQTIALVQRRDLVDRRGAFEFFVASSLLDEEQRMELAQATLASTLQLRPRGLDEQEAARQLRFSAAAVLREGMYAPATAVLIRHFNQTVLEFDRGQTVRARVLEAIAALGATGTPEAAVRLTDYLELLNTYSEIDRPYDAQVVLATIQNLAILGQPSSYNALFFTTLIDNFPSRIRDAAREALTAVTR